MVTNRRPPRLPGSAPVQVRPQEAPKAKQIGETHKGNGYNGEIYDGADWVRWRLGLNQGDVVRLFHHTNKESVWAEPGVKTTVKAIGDGLFGPAFYTATKPPRADVYGSAELQLSFPVEALKGKKVVEIYGRPGPNMKMPPGVDIAVRHWGKDDVWFMFKPGSEAWLNRVAIECDFDFPSEPHGWSEPK